MAALSLISQSYATIVSSLSTLLLFNLPAPALATTTVANDTLPLKPWNITRLGTGSPSGRPASFPYTGLYVTISDPNTISLGPTKYTNHEAILPPSTVDCTIRWNGYFEEPYNWVTPCTGSLSHGKWSVEMLKAPVNDSGVGGDPSPMRNFILKFRLEEGVVTDNGRVVTKIFEAKEGFAVGKNLDFVCGGSGICSSGLKAPAGSINGEGDRSVLIKQKLVETRIRCFSDGDC